MDSEWSTWLKVLVGCIDGCGIAGARGTTGARYLVHSRSGSTMYMIRYEEDAEEPITPRKYRTKG